MTFEITPVSVFFAVISTPGIRAPVASATVPVSVALMTCPNPADAIRSETRVTIQKRFKMHLQQGGLAKVKQTVGDDSCRRGFLSMVVCEYIMRGSHGLDERNEARIV